MKLKQQQQKRTTGQNYLGRYKKGQGKNAQINIFHILNMFQRPEKANGKLQEPRIFQHP